MDKATRQRGTRSRTLLAAVLLASSLAGAVDVPDYGHAWCVIGAPGNRGYFGPATSPFFELPGRGRVDYVYRMGKTESSTAEWVEYFNAFAQFEPMAAIDESPYHWGAVFVGTLDDPEWEVGPGPDDAMKPADVGIRSCARYCNWLCNGKAMTREAFMDGAYDATTFGFDEDADRVTDDYTRRPGALFFMPRLDEWYKAVYYDPDRFGPGEEGWWTYPHRSEDYPIPGLPGEPGAETMVGSEIDPFERFDVPLLSYPETFSPWGLRDASGCMGEWSEEIARLDGTFGILWMTFGTRADALVDLSDPDDPVTQDDIGWVNGGYAYRRMWGFGLRLASVQPCEADLGVPYGVLDLADIAGFVVAYTGGDPAADLAEPFGLIDIADLAAFVVVFNRGCTP